MKMNEIYEAPVLEVLNVVVESGFAASPTGGEYGGEGEFENPGGGNL